MRSAPPAAMRTAAMSSGFAAIFRWVTTAPFFCDRPTMSMMPTPLPSICAAMPRIWPMVTTPVPPMPVTRIDHGRSSAGSCGSGSTGKTVASAGNRFRSTPRIDQFAALDGDEARAEALEAGIILVAGRLVDLPLAAEGGLDRHDRDAVRLHAAIAAAFADQLVDEDALVGIGEGAALAPPRASRRHRSGRR